MLNVLSLLTYINLRQGHCSQSQLDFAAGIVLRRALSQCLDSVLTHQLMGPYAQAAAGRPVVLGQLPQLGSKILLLQTARYKLRMFSIMTAGSIWTIRHTSHCPGLFWPGIL